MSDGSVSSFSETTTGEAWTALITPTASGTVTVNVAAGVAADLAGNDNTAATPVSSTYTAPATTNPKVTSIERQTPPSSPTNADSLTWRVTFNKDVKNVNAADFTLSGTIATLTISEATASTVYDVTASGGDLAVLNDTVTLDFSDGQHIQDTTDNALTSTPPTGINDTTYVLDNIQLSLTIMGVPATSAVAFSATFSFSEPVTGFGVEGVTGGNGAAWAEVASAHPRAAAATEPMARSWQWSGQRSGLLPHLVEREAVPSLPTPRSCGHQRNMLLSMTPCSADPSPPVVSERVASSSNSSGW